MATPLNGVRLGLVCLAVTAAASVRTYAAEIDVTTMILQTGINLEKENISESVFFPTNPLLKTHLVESGESSSLTSYDIAWSNSGGAFNFDFAHAVEDDDYGPIVLSGGSIVFTTERDLVFDFDFSYSYQLFGPFVHDVSLIVRKATTTPTMLLHAYNAGASSLDPPVGTFASSGQLFLPAGERYRFSYSVRHNAFGDDTGAVGTGSGHLYISITPDPATAALLLPGLLLLARRARRSR